MKEPIFYTRPRDGKISLWVEMDGHVAHNIWDLPEKIATTEVLNAIASAFARGVSFTMAEIGRTRIHTPMGKWERRDA